MEPERRRIGRARLERKVKTVGDDDRVVRDRKPPDLQVGRLRRVDRPRPVSRRGHVARLVPRVHANHIGAVRETGAGERLARGHLRLLPAVQRPDVGQDRRVLRRRHIGEAGLLRDGPVDRRTIDGRHRRRNRVDDPEDCVRHRDILRLVRSIDGHSVRTFNSRAAKFCRNVVNDLYAIRQPMILDLRFIRGIGRIREVSPVRDDNLAHRSRHAEQGKVLRRLEIDNPGALDHRTGIACRIRRKHAHRVRALGYLSRADEVGRCATRRDLVQGPRVRQRRQVVRRDLEVEAPARRDIAFRRRAAVQEAEIRRRRAVIGLLHRRLGRRVRIVGRVRDHAFRHHHGNQPIRDRRHFQLIDLRHHPAFASILAGLAESRNLAIRNDNRLLRQLRHALASHRNRNLERSIRRAENIRRLARQGDNRALCVINARQRRLLALLVQRGLVAVARAIPHLVRIDRDGHRFLVDERRHAVVLRIHPELEYPVLLNDLKLVGDSAGLHRDALIGEVRHLLGEGRHHLHRRRLPVEVAGRRACKRDSRMLRVESPAQAVRLRNVPRLVRSIHKRRKVGILANARDAADEVRSRFPRFAKRPVVGNQMVVGRIGDQVIRLDVRNGALLQIVRDNGQRWRRLVERPDPDVRLGNVARRVRRVALHLKRPFLLDLAD